MGVPLLIFLLSLYHLQTTINSEILSDAKGNANSFGQEEDDLGVLLLPPPEIDTELNALDGNDDVRPLKGPSEGVPFVKNGRDQTELEFAEPISSVSIDYAKNMIVLKFPKQRPRFRGKTERDSEARERQLVENFMRFGRSPADFMRLGKRQSGNEGMRDSRGDSFMRFGRAGSKDFLRFGRSAGDFMRFGRTAGDYMRFGRSAKQDFMRFGRAQKMRRETDKNFMRLGRPDNFMRFGRSDANNAAANYMRFGRMDKSFMRFGKSLTDAKVNDTKEGHDEKDNDTGNPMDKAMKLFNKEQQDVEDIDYPQN